ncbi:MAG: hypothetical protein WCG29_10485 [Desulfomonile sp.]|jgi:outer membrane lipoprotein-sorting protein|nr:hypothetical protein [Deltaproteobacteria bacterium]
MKYALIFDDFSHIFAPANALFFKALVIAAILLEVAVCPVRAEPSLKPEQIPNILVEKGKNLSALKAVMSIQSMYDGGKSRQDVKGFLLYRRPSDFRFQGIGPSGNSLFELVIRATHFELYVPTDGKILKGEKDCFARKFPDVAEIEGLIPILLLQWKDVRFDRLLLRDNEKIVLRVTFQGRVWGITLEPQNLFLKRLVRLSPGGETDLTADFGDFSSGEDGWLPRRFEVQSPQGGWKTLVRISKIETNPFIVEKNFLLEPVFSTSTESCR